MDMRCIPGLNTVYGGSDNADVNGGVTLNITNGKFLQVFGGNNRGGRVKGPITVNIEETGCQPIIIGELYGGGNEAPYSIYGYYNVIENNDTVLRPCESLNDNRGFKNERPDQPYNDPQVNIKSFTSIGNVFGGGYGEKAEMVGNPHVNINVGNGKYYDNADYAGETLQINQNYSVTTPGHTRGKIGTIDTVFGGGNAAKVIGETYVNIGTMLGGKMEMETMELINGSKQTIPVLGADIIGNVYGGGNNAEVTGGTHVQIGPTPTNPAPPVNNNNGGDDDDDSGDSGNNSQQVPQRDTGNAATEQLLNRTVTPIRQ